MFFFTFLMIKKVSVCGVWSFFSIFVAKNKAARVQVTSHTPFKKMKTTLLLVGKTTDKHISACIDDYTGRIVHYMPFDIQTIPELKNTKNLSIAQQKEREGELILRQILESDHVVLLDEHGIERRSIDFASWLEKKSMSTRRMVFVIGGAYGFSPEVYQRANEKISLSQMTFSHQMVRLVFVEQVYRACTIIKGEPYHHE